MVRGLVVGVGGAAIVVAGLVGCSGKEEKKADQPAGTATISSGSMTASTGSGTAKVTIDGQPKDIQGQIACTTAAGNFSIGIGDTATGIAVVMAEDGSTVNSVGLGNVDGVVLGYQQGMPGGSATATKDGKTYTVTGNASGVDMANPMQQVTKPFEIVVTCP